MVVHLGGENTAGFADLLLDIGNVDYSNIDRKITKLFLHGGSYGSSYNSKNLYIYSSNSRKAHEMVV